MDTKLKKSRPFLAWLCFFFGVNILLLIFFGWIGLKDGIRDNSRDIYAVLRSDYKDYIRFKDTISNIFMNLAEAVTVEAQADNNYVSALSIADIEGINLIYYAKNLKTGKIVANTTADKLSFSENEISALPEGYDYYLYFDGEEITGKKGSQILDVYRTDSGYQSGMRRFLNGAAVRDNQKLKDTIALIFVKQEIVENPYKASSLFWIKKEADNLRLAIFGVLAVSLLGVVLTVVSIVKRKSKYEFDGKLARFTGWFWVEVKVFATIFVFFIFGRLMSGVLALNAYTEKAVAAVFILWWMYLIFIDLWINRRKVFSHNIIHSGIKLYRKYENNKPFQKKMLQRVYVLIAAESILVFFTLFFTIGIFAGGMYRSKYTIPALVFAAAGIYLLYRYLRKYTNTVKDMGLLVDHIDALKNGDMAAKRAINPGADLYDVQENLNRIQEGVGRAVEEKTQSDRMKVELITNVSHDLKTPLTSIVSYVDLLSREDGLPSHVVDYVNILSQKSERLKTLIQDLFDLSKAASGDIRLEMGKLDLGKLVRQTLADMDEQVVQSGLAIKVNMPETPVSILSDGSKLYRVFQNLFSNALKYSLTGSRVYVELLLKEQEVAVIIKNTAAYEMNFNEEEIIERFVRGDQARSTEGSGLGLAIARNFTQACGGRFDIKIDGDLFKTIVSFRVIDETV